MLYEIAATPNILKQIIVSGTSRSNHLQQLEDESIHIMREVAAQFSKPVMLYSIGKDSSVMLHLAMKAFHPSKPPFPLMHVDTTWKFREMISFRNERAKTLGLDRKTLYRMMIRHGLRTEDIIVQTRIAGRIREGGVSITNDSTVRLTFGGTLNEPLDVVIVG